MLSWMCLERTEEKEAQDVLSCSNPGGCSAYLAVEIDFSLPLSLPRVLAWMTFLARVHRSELHP